MAAIQHTCRKCGTSIPVPVRYADRELKCITCGTAFTIEPPAPPSPPAVTPATAALQPRTEILGQLMLFTPVAATFAIWFWVGQMALIQGPGSALSAITVGTVLLTAVLAAAEAGQLGMGGPTDLDKRGKRREGPVAWFFGLVLLWIIAYPMYLARRSDYGLKNHAALGLIVALIFVLSALLLGQAIEGRRSEIMHLFGR